MSYRQYSVVARHETTGPIVRFCHHGEGQHPNHFGAAWCCQRLKVMTRLRGGPFVWSIRNDRPNR